MCQCMMVVCGRCGNNSCNGGYGIMPYGEDCYACKSAHEMMDEGYEEG